MTTKSHHLICCDHIPCTRMTTKSHHVICCDHIPCTRMTTKSHHLICCDHITHTRMTTKSHHIIVVIISLTPESPQNHTISLLWSYHSHQNDHKITPSHCCNHIPCTRMTTKSHHIICCDHIPCTRMTTKSHHLICCDHITHTRMTTKSHHIIVVIISLTPESPQNHANSLLWPRFFINDVYRKHYVHTFNVLLMGPLYLQQKIIWWIPLIFEIKKLFQDHFSKPCIVYHSSQCYEKPHLTTTVTAQNECHSIETMGHHL